MARANRHFIQGQIWHLTQRCHKKEWLLKFAKDRRRWMLWLFKAQRRYGLCILNYVVTSNHVHLLVHDQGHGEISRSMQMVSSRTGQEYNKRKSRQGAFWQDRYHATVNPRRTIEASETFHYLKEPPPRLYRLYDNEISP